MRQIGRGRYILKQLQFRMKCDTFLLLVKSVHGEKVLISSIIQEEYLLRDVFLDRPGPGLEVGARVLRHRFRKQVIISHVSLSGDGIHLVFLEKNSFLTEFVGLVSAAKSENSLVNSLRSLMQDGLRRFRHHALPGPALHRRKSGGLNRTGHTNLVAW